MVLGDKETGQGLFAKALFSEMLYEYNYAIATYKGSTKKFFGAIAFNLDIPTEDQESGKTLTVDALKDEILESR